MLANAAMRQALINMGLTVGLDCDTVESNKCQVRHVDSKGYGSCLKRSA